MQPTPAAGKNATGQQWLEEILDSDDIWVRPNALGGIDVFDKKTGRGARFNAKGEFITFL